MVEGPDPRRKFHRTRVALRPTRRAWRRARARLHPGNLRFVRLLALRRERTRLRKATTLTFNQKVRYKMLADRRPLLTTFADKLAVRAYVESRVGASYLPSLYAATSAPRTLSRDELPREFVVKPTRGSGAVVIVADFASPEAILPDPPGHTKWPNTGFVKAMVHPDALDWDRLLELCEHWLSLRFGGDDAWAYRNVPSRLLVEELLDGSGVPPDYKFFVFHGHARMIQVDLDRFTDHTRSLYTPAWERLSVEYEYDLYPAGVDVEQPSVLPEMLHVAERLGAETDFVRVDLYCVRERVVFGELTSYPVAARGKFNPPEFDRQLGEWWTQPKRYPRQ
jgi:TupA-like ATPgrasp